VRVLIDFDELAATVYPRRVIPVGWLCLAAMILAYGVANLLQSIAANRVNVHETLHPGLFVRLVGYKA
jgi:hypothetical protein